MDENQLDMFNENHNRTVFNGQKKTQEEEYISYINSSRWKKKRQQRLEISDYKCDLCGISKWSAKLEVHHQHYENFMNERMEDLMVVCPKCHENQDKLRERDTRIKNKRKLVQAQFNGWATKVYGEDYDDWCDIEAIYDEFLEWSERKSWDD